MIMGKNYRAELTGVFGDPVDGNPTGVMTEAAYEAMGQNFRYITMKVTKEDFPDAMRAVKALHMKGVNLTMPHKLNVLPYLDELSPAASIIGAVNTIVVREDGTLFGENTDGKGFIQALENAGEKVSGKSITILGAGGVASPVGSAVKMVLTGFAAIFFGIFTAASFLRNVRMFLGENRFSRKADAGLFRYYTGGENTCQTPGTGHGLPSKGKRCTIYSYGGV